MLTDGELDWLKNFELGNDLVPLKTFFDTGARRYYEDPTTEILKFFLDPNEQHGFGTRVLEVFLKHVEFKDNDKPEATLDCKAYTQSPARVDLTLVSTDWVIAIENKINHHDRDNPFDNYEREIKRAFPDKGERYHFVFLSPRPPNQSKWEWLGAVKLYAALRALADKLDELKTDWAVFFRHFVMHQSNITAPLEKLFMKSEKLNEVAANVGLLLKAQQIYTSYEETIKTTLKRAIGEVLPNSDGSPRAEDWKPLGRAIKIKVYSDEGFFILFLTITSETTVQKDRRFEWRFVVQYLMTGTEIGGTYPEDMREEGFVHHSTEAKGTIFWFWAGANTILDAFGLVKNAAIKIRDYRESRSDLLVSTPVVGAGP